MTTKAKNRDTIPAPNTGPDVHTDISDLTEAGREKPVGEAEQLMGVYCRPDVCQLEDRGGKWSGITNYECPRCQFSTIEVSIVQARNPKYAATIKA